MTREAPATAHLDGNPNFSHRHTGKLLHINRVMRQIRLCLDRYRQRNQQAGCQRATKVHVVRAEAGHLGAFSVQGASHLVDRKGEERTARGSSDVHRAHKRNCARSDGVSAFGGLEILNALTGSKANWNRTDQIPFISRPHRASMQPNVVRNRG
jgi:hypothetical protein